MHKTIAHGLALFLVLTTSITPIQAQIEKGMSLVEIEGFLDLGNTGIGEPTPRIKLTLLKAINTKWMLGGEFSFANDLSVVTDVDGQIENYDKYRVSPSARYYFSSAKWSPFITATNHVSIVKFIDRAGSSINTEMDIGLGVTHFLGEGVALEAEAKANTLRFGAGHEFDRKFEIGMGMKFYLKSLSKILVDSLPSRIYKKGVFSTSARIGYSTFFGHQKSKWLEISPDITYFVTDRVSLSARLGYSRWKKERFSSSTKSIGLGANRHFQLDRRIFLKIGLNGLFTDRDWHFDASKSKVLDISVDGELSYFAGSKRLYFGYRYSYLDFINRDPRDTHRFNQAVYAGVDYYLSENVFFQGILDVNLSKSNENYIGRGSTGILTLGLGFNLSK